MHVLQNLHWFVLLLGGLVFFHELGHFAAAKAFGIKVLKFSLGFGPRLWGFTKGDTEYVISALPLGGYVKMLGEVPGAEISPEDLPRAFSQRPLWQRALVVVAGPFFNLLLAFVVYAAVFVGPQTFGSTKLGIVTQGEPAWRAGLRPGDRLVAVDGEPLRDFDDVRSAISNRPGERLHVTYVRDGTERTIELTPEAREEANVFQETETRGRIGVSPDYVKPIVGIVDKESPAARAGVESGDVVKSVNGKPVETWYEVRSAVRSTPAGETVRLQIERSGVTKDMALTPVPEPPGLDRSLESTADAPGGYTGLVSAAALVDKVEPDTPAARAGLQPGDRLVRLRIEKLDGTSEEAPINVWKVDLRAFSGLDARNKFVLTFQRGRELLVRPLELEARLKKDELKNERTEYVFGATGKDVLGTYTLTRKIGPLEATGLAARKVTEDATLIGVGIAKIMQGRIPLSTMGGPIMLFVIAEESAKHGFTTFLQVMAVISVNLGILNLLPVPILDGGHLLFFGIEAVRRRPPSLRTRELAQVVGLALLMLLMVLVFKNDILRYVLG